MRWVKAVLKIPVEHGVDELGNVTDTVYENHIANARLTNWTLEERAALDPEYTRVNRKCILKSNKADVKRATAVEIDDAEYLITDRLILDRWQILHIRGYKQ